MGQSKLPVAGLPDRLILDRAFRNRTDVPESSEVTAQLCSRRGVEAAAGGPASSRRRLRAGFAGEACRFLRSSPCRFEASRPMRMIRRRLFFENEDDFRREAKWLGN